ncbi:MAG: MjaI family restriction endonuclease [Ignavibacteriae bacterium]|nr:MjaI family restriction endonuclease [Ignavibacteria bacterium]MBI3364302.1 MjaI family restriction endonuclease [Ignavibacteriota bacterium]
MSKEWILNSAMNRWQLNFKRNVGAVSEEIRKYSPKKVEDWRSYYFTNVYPEDHLEELGRRLYTKVSEVLTKEIEEIIPEDCVNYIKEVVIERTFDGYTTEIQTVYGQLQEALGVEIHPATDEWDRLFNVDFYIKIKDKYIGLQIKPVGFAYITQIIKEQEIQAQTHKEFSKKFGGPVFYVYSIKEGTQKRIYNPEVIDEIKKQIDFYKNH